jgi:hypothetical protein
MSKKKKRVFDAGAMIREIARECIGQPRPTAILVDKRQRKRQRVTEREVREALKGPGR